MERPTRPMRVHKDLLIRLLKTEPADALREMLPGFEGTAEEAIEILVKDKRQYLDEFQDEEESR